MGNGSEILSGRPFPIPHSRHLHILRLLIIPKPQEDGLAQEPVLRDFLIPYIANELRLDPDVIGTLGERAVLGRLAGRCLAHERLQLGTDLVQLRAAEARSRAPTVDQLTIFVRADVQRPEAATRAFGLGEADDDEVVDAVGANLQPIAGSAAAIGTVRLLGHDTLESQLHDLLVQRLAVLLEVLRVAQRACLREDLLEDLLALDERQLAQVVASERQEIEDVEGSRRFDRRALRLARAQPGARLEHIEVWPPRLVEDDQLAVENHSLERNRLDRARDLRE